MKDQSHAIHRQLNRIVLENGINSYDGSGGIVFLFCRIHRRNCEKHQQKRKHLLLAINQWNRRHYFIYFCFVFDVAFVRTIEKWPYCPHTNFMHFKPWSRVYDLIFKNTQQKKKNVLWIQVRNVTTVTYRLASIRLMYTYYYFFSFISEKSIKSIWQGNRPETNAVRHMNWIWLLFFRMFPFVLGHWSPILCWPGA